MFGPTVLIVILGLLALLAMRVALEVYIAYRVRAVKKNTKYTVISVRVSKENETGPIVAEQIFSTLHGIYQNIGFWDRMRGASQDTISFEIANIERSIKFYIAFPAHLRNLVEGQVYAQYPDVEIEDVEDYSKYTPFKEEKPGDLPILSDSAEMAMATDLPAIQEVASRKKGSLLKNAVGLELGLTSPDLYPIKRYSQFEDKTANQIIDPLAGITATLSKLNSSSEQAWIQIAVSPLSDRWRGVFTECIKIVNNGIWGGIDRLQAKYIAWYCNRNPLFRTVFFPLYILFWLHALRLKSPSLTGDESGGSSVQEASSKSHEGETSTTAAIDKVIKLMFDVSVRVVYVPEVKDNTAVKVKLREIAGSFKQFNMPHLNGFAIREFVMDNSIVQRYNKREIVDPFVLNVEELATVFHLPNLTVTTPNIYWVRSKKVEPPIDLPLARTSQEHLTLLGKSNFRGASDEFGVKTLDRRRHMYIIGKTGMGKSTLLENMLYSDIQAGRGVAVIDPHGDLAEAVLTFVPSHRTNDVVVFDPADREFPVGFNMLENIDPAYNSIVCSGLVGVFKKLYAHSWGPRLEHILRNTILALLEYPNTTMLGITRILQDASFRRKVVRKISDPIVLSFWQNEFEKMQPRQQLEAISPILNKVGQFLSSPIVRNIVGQPKSKVDLRFMMDKKKIVVVNLSKGKIGEDISSLLGSMMITKFQLDAMSRANIAEKDRVDFYLYVDEFQNFATDSFATILSEARKYRLNLTMANQYIAQMPEEVRDAVFGNVGSILSFQVGYDDAEYLTQQFAEEVSTNDMVSLSKYTSYMRLLVDGMPTKTFSLDTLPPPDLDIDQDRLEKVIRLSRERYGRPREEVEDKIKRWSMASEDEKSEKKGDKKNDKKGDKKPEGKNENSSQSPKQDIAAAAPAAPVSPQPESVQVSSPAPAAVTPSSDASAAQQSAPKKREGGQRRSSGNQRRPRQNRPRREGGRRSPQKPRSASSQPENSRTPLTPPPAGDAPRRPENPL